MIQTKQFQQGWRLKCGDMKLWSFIAFNLVVLSEGSFFLKLKSLFILSVVSMPFVVLADGILDLDIIDFWFRQNMEYIMFVFVAVILDHMIGSYVHLFVKRDFSFEKNLKGLAAKIFLTITVAILVRGMVFILGTGNIITEYFTAVMRLMVFLYPAGSALVNISLITGGKFPPLGFMKKIQKFNSDVNMNAFKDEENSNENNELDQ